MRLLLVEDDRMLANALRAGFGQSGCVMDWIQHGLEAEGALRACAYDGVFMDLGLPDVDGKTLLKRIRAAKFSGPIIVISARGRIQDRVELLDIGADDYLVKPFDLDELAARLRAVIRRSNGLHDPAIELEYGPLRLLPDSHTVTWNGHQVPLTNKEFWILETLLRKRNRIVSRGQLEATLYGWDDDIGSNAVEVYIHHLRRKFGAELIQTVRGVGYRIGLES